MKLPDNFQICEHSWPCLFHIIVISPRLFTSLCRWKQSKVGKKQMPKWLRNFIPLHYGEISVFQKALNVFFLKSTPVKLYKFVYQLSTLHKMNKYQQKRRLVVFCDKKKPTPWLFDNFPAYYFPNNWLIKICLLHVSFSLMLIVLSVGEFRVYNLVTIHIQLLIWTLSSSELAASKDKKEKVNFQCFSYSDKIKFSFVYEKGRKRRLIIVWNIQKVKL